jgi:trans-aconitate methyltransferase
MEAPIRVLEKDWASFYQVTAGRATRPLFDAALASRADRPPGQAVDLGAGDGTETIALLERGWRVLSVDAEPAHAAFLDERVAPSHRDRLEVITAGLEAVMLPPSDLVYAGYSLPFLVGGAFHDCWSGIRTALRPGGVLAVHLFGPNDTWHDDPTMTFLARTSVEALLDGLVVEQLTESDEDGPSAVGPKHWHLFEVLARRPSEPA